MILLALEGFAVVLFAVLRVDPSWLGVMLNCIESDQVLDGQFTVL